MKKIRVGSGGSRLAVIEAEGLMRAIEEYDESAETELVTVTGEAGLELTKSALDEALKTALREGRIDVALRDCREVSLENEAELPIVAYSRRDDARDVLVLPKGAQEMDKGKPIGCASDIMALQLQVIFPGIEIEVAEGGIEARIRRLDAGEYAALALDAAGIKRLGQERRIESYFTYDDILPEACQGIMAAQGRAGKDMGYLSGYDDCEARECALAERAFARRLVNESARPIAAYAELSEGEITIRGLMVHADGLAIYELIRGERERGEELAVKLAERMLESKGRP